MSRDAPKDRILVPWQDENGKTTAVSMMALGISNSSANKQNAWRFIKVALGEDVQNMDILYGTPVLREGTEYVENARWTEKEKVIAKEQYDLEIGFTDQIDSVVFRRLPAGRSMKSLFPSSRGISRKRQSFSSCETISLSI